MSDNYPEDFDKYGSGVEELPEEEEPEEGTISEDLEEKIKKTLTPILGFIGAGIIVSLYFAVIIGFPILVIALGVKWGINLAG